MQLFLKCAHSGRHRCALTFFLYIPIVIQNTNLLHQITDLSVSVPLAAVKTWTPSKRSAPAGKRFRKCFMSAEYSPSPRQLSTKVSPTCTKQDFKPVKLELTENYSYCRGYHNPHRSLWRFVGFWHQHLLVSARKVSHSVIVIRI